MPSYMSWAEKQKNAAYRKLVEEKTALLHLGEALCSMVCESRSCTLLYLHFTCQPRLPRSIPLWQIRATGLDPDKLKKLIKEEWK